MPRKSLDADGYAAKFDSLHTPEPNTGCWLWLGTLNDGGYPVMWMWNAPVAMHRYAFQRFVRRLRDGEGALHRCDVRCCVNPAHLFPGGNAVNVADMAAKARQARGERQHLARLTSAAVVEIRRARAAGAKLRDLAARHGVTAAAISYACRGDTWKHVSDPAHPSAHEVVSPADKALLPREGLQGPP